jgi:nitrite reductase/ring-hydroxylating ferredoxin subunit
MRAQEAAPHLNGKTWSRYEEAVLGFRNYWYPAIMSRRLGSKPVPLHILGEELVFIRHAGRAYALQNRCPHRGLPLSEGRCEFPGTPTISCCYHGWTFDVRTGEMVAAITDGPASPLIGKVRVPSYPVEEKNGVIWVYIGDGTPPRLVEDVPEVFLRDDTTVVSRITERKGNWRLGAENGLDPAHATYLHRTAWMCTPLKFPAYRGKVTPAIDGKWVGYTDNLVWEADYPGLGHFPRSRPWWKVVPFGVSNTIIVHLRLPGYLRVTNHPRVGTDHYEWYVPITADTYRYLQFKVRKTKGVGATLFRAEYQLLWRWLADKQFNDQDMYAVAHMEDFYNRYDGWNREFLFRQDAVLTKWRKFASENARAIQPCPAEPVQHS